MNDRKAKVVLGWKASACEQWALDDGLLRRVAVFSSLKTMIPALGEEQALRTFSD